MSYQYKSQPFSETAEESWCHICGLHLDGVGWHCLDCGKRWPLTREACGDCQAERPFDFFPRPPGTELVWDLTELPAVISRPTPPLREDV